jgi:hypothetical protein
MDPSLSDSINNRQTRRAMWRFRHLIASRLDLPSASFFARNCRAGSWKLPWVTAMR